MQPIPPERPIAVTLRALEWNAVLTALGKEEWRIANPLIQAIAGQIEQIVEAPEVPQHTNGQAHAGMDARSG